MLTGGTGSGAYNCGAGRTIPVISIKHLSTTWLKPFQKSYRPVVAKFCRDSAATKYLRRQFRPSSILRGARREVYRDTVYATNPTDDRDRPRGTCLAPFTGFPAATSRPGGPGAR